METMICQASIICEESDIISVLKTSIEYSFMFFKWSMIYHLGDWNQTVLYYCFEDSFVQRNYIES